MLTKTHLRAHRTTLHRFTYDQERLFSNTRVGRESAIRSFAGNEGRKSDVKGADDDDDERVHQISESEKKISPGESRYICVYLCYIFVYRLLRAGGIICMTQPWAQS